MYAWGYRYGEVPLDRLPNLQVGTVIHQRQSFTELRAPVAVSLGCHVDRTCLPHPDLQDSDTTRAGITKRFARETPVANRSMLMRLKRFTLDWLRTNMTPLDKDTDVSTKTWLEGTNYPKWRRDELEVIAENMEIDGWRPKYKLVKAFVKDEFYSELKHARLICSRSDFYKVLTGPYFKVIENVLYEHPAFIKHIPVSERPAYVKAYLELEGCNYMATDYTSFEALFTPELMDAVEMQLYDYMLQHVHNGRDTLRLIRRVQLGRNHIDSKFVSVDISGKRMSGEMCTSLGNGFSNLMLMLFMCSEVGTRNVVGCVEGDDGLFRGDGPFPTSQDFERLGLLIKLEVHEQINTASFCGMIFDTDDYIIVTDVMAQLARFGWTSGRYGYASDRILRRLLRSKALSMAYSYPGCPVLHSLAKYGLRVTSDQKDAKLSRYSQDWWSRERDKLQSGDLELILSKVPTPGARLLVEKKYGLSMEDQLRIENYLDSLTTIVPLSCKAIESNCKPHWEYYYAGYCFEHPVDQRSAQNFGQWPTLRGHRNPW